MPQIKPMTSLRSLAAGRAVEPVAAFDGLRARAALGVDAGPALPALSSAASPRLSAREPAVVPSRARAQLPNLVTALNLTSGFGAILAASQGAVLPASGLILAAQAFDMLDGRLARALGVASPLGIQLDSLADVVSFGVAPAALVYKAALEPWGAAGFAVAAAFAAAGMYRLARFNVMASAPSPDHGDSFTGMPIPAGAGLVAGAVIALQGGPASWIAPLAAATTLAAAAAMASTIPYPAFKKGGAKAIMPPAAAAIVVATMMAGAGFANEIPAALFGAYALTGPALHLRARR